MNPSRPPRPSECEAIEATAAAWLALRDDGLTPEQTAEFAQWCAADARHQAAVARLEATWMALQRLRDFRPEAVRHPDRDLLSSSSDRRRGRSWRGFAGPLALAASLVLAAGWWLASPKGQTDSAWQTHTTTPSGYGRVSLEDGSTIELNSASEVRVQFFPRERRVRLLRGEAHFSVAKDQARPFLVEAGAVAVRAVGTAFNVRLGVKDVEVLVTEGRVAVATAKEAGSRTEGGRPEAGTEGPAWDPIDRIAGDVRGAVQAELVANERIVLPAVRSWAAGVTPARPVIERIAPELVREALAWQGTRLVFVETLLADAVVEFNRRNAVQLVLADAELGALPIGGSFRAENVDAFVRLLAAGGEVTVDRSSPARIVLRKAATARPPE